MFFKIEEKVTERLQICGMLNFCFSESNPDKEVLFSQTFSDAAGLHSKKKRFPHSEFTQPHLFFVAPSEIKESYWVLSIKLSGCDIRDPLLHTHCLDL